MFCDARTIREEDLKQAVIQAINELFKNRNNFLKVLEQNIVQILSNHLHDKLVKVEKELEVLQHSLIGLANSNKDYNDVVDNIYKRREEKQQLQLEIAVQNNGRERLEQISALLKEQTCELETYDEQLVRRMYWDKNGFSNMSSNNNWKSVANRIGTIMGHTNSSGVSRSKIVPGLQKYIKERGYANSFTISRDTSLSFSKMKTLIKNGNPSMMSTNGWITQTGGHNITLVGYEEYYATFKFKWYRSVIVRDNWKSTPKDVWFLYGSEDVDDIYLNSKMMGAF